jgi:hypothetical protein
VIGYLGVLLQLFDLHMHSLKRFCLLSYIQFVRIKTRTRAVIKPNRPSKYGKKSFAAHTREQNRPDRTITRRRFRRLFISHIIFISLSIRRRLENSKFYTTPAPQPTPSSTYPPLSSKGRNTRKSNIANKGETLKRNHLKRERAEETQTKTE